MSVKFVMLHIWFLGQIDPMCNLCNSHEVCTLRVNVETFKH